MVIVMNSVVLERLETLQASLASIDPSRQTDAAAKVAEILARFQRTVSDAGMAPVKPLKKARHECTSVAA